MEIAEDPHFKQIILTHNFDFYRTIQSRFVKYSDCYMASKSATGVLLEPASGIQNVFVKDWKPSFSTEPKKKIACIPFMRNLIEYTRDATDVSFLRLTSLLHWKVDSAQITISDLDDIYNDLFSQNITSANSAATVMSLIEHEAGECLKAADGINFENKIVLAIAIRLVAEQFMVTKINDPAFVAGIDSNQTTRLLRKFRESFNAEVATINVLQRVALMTPENIHLNSFMYEPILDMSDGHLRKLYGEVKALV